jgi:hypothetical protein
MFNRDSRELPDNWSAGIEKSKMKANRHLGDVIAIDQATSIVVGKLEDVDIDTLWSKKFPYCRLLLKGPIRFRTSGEFECKLGEQELFFVNSPDKIMSLDELSIKYPVIAEDVTGKAKKGEF